MTTPTPSAPPPPRRQSAVAGALVTLGVIALAYAWTHASEPPSRFALVENTVLRAALLGMLAALWWGRAALSEITAPASFGQSALLMAIALVALGVRCATESLPWHAFNWVGNLAQRVTPEPQPFWYGNGFGIFMRIPFVLGLPVDEAIFAGNRLAGALAVPALYGVDRVLGGSTRKALWSAALLAILPIHAQLSASESMQIVPGLFMLVAMIGFGVHAQTGSRALLYAGMLAVTYGALSRPESLLIVVVLPVLYLGDGRLARLRDPALWIGGLVAMGVGAPLLLHALGYLDLGGPFQNFGGHNLHNMVSTPGHALAQWYSGMRDSGQVMVGLGIAGVIGLLVLGVRGPWRMLVASLVLLAMQVQLAGFENNFANRQQLQIPAWPWLLLGVSALPEALSAILERLGWRNPLPASVVGGGALVLLIAGAVGCRLVQPHGWDQQDEWRFLQEHDDLIQQAGPTLPIVRFSRGDDADPVFPFFPTYRISPDVPLLSLTDLIDRKVQFPALYYRSPHCYTRYEHLQFTAHNLRPRCEEAEAKVNLEPLATAKITSGSYTGVWQGNPDSIEIGLFRITPRTDAVGGTGHAP